MKMKRRASLPLLRSIEPEVYLIDTSAWLDIDRASNSEDIWRTIVTLIEQGRIVACAQVLNEMRENPIYPLRFKPYEKALQAGDRDGDDLEFLRHVGSITHQYPGMSRARSFKTPADPYVVALAELEGYVVVADENSSKRPNRKIPGVCQQRGIRCLTLCQFMAAQMRRS